MKKILLNVDKYQYDIHSLFKAFYGTEDVKVVIGSGDGAEDFFARVDIISESVTEAQETGKVVVTVFAEGEEKEIAEEIIQLYS